MFVLMHISKNEFKRLVLNSFEGNENETVSFKKGDTVVIKTNVFSDLYGFYFDKHTHDTCRIATKLTEDKCCQSLKISFSLDCVFKAKVLLTEKKYKQYENN